MHDEIELKLALPPDDLRRLEESALVRDLAARQSTSKRLVSTYFDTPAQTLRRKGMALRVRHIGEKRIQTLKALAEKGASGLQRYREYEAEIDRDEPDLSLIDDEGLQSQFEADQLASELRPIFTTDISRRTIPLRLHDSEIELCLDQGEICSGDRRMPVSEAELELVSGQPACVYELALALHDKLHFRLEAATKAARGYALAEQTTPQPIKAIKVTLSQGMTAGEAFVEIARACVKQIRINEPVVLMGVDPEGVHQLRVGVRRLRGLISAFRPLLDPAANSYLRGELQWLQRALGPAREWDVFIDETLQSLIARLPEEAALAEMRKAADAARAAAYGVARKALLDKRFTGLLLHLEFWMDYGGWLLQPAADAPIERFSAKVLRKLDRKLLKAGGQHHELTEPEYHRVRILGKRLRYAGEFFHSLYQETLVEAHVGTLVAIQDTLGSLNDAIVGRGQLAELETLMERTGKEGSAAAIACATVRGWQAARIQDDLQRFPANWEQFCTVARYW